MARAIPVKTSTPGVYKVGNVYMARPRVHGKQIKVYAATKKGVVEKRAQLVADLSRGEYRASSGHTFGEYAREWVDSYAGRTTRGFRESTRTGYRRSIEKAAPWFDARSKRLSDIEPADVRAFIRWLFDEQAQGKRLSLSTVRNHVAALRALFATAAEDGVLRHNPAYGVRISRPGPALDHDEEQVHALERDEARRLLAALPAEWRLFFDVLLQTGIRIGEAVELRWQDVTFGERPELHVRRRFYRGDVDTPKSKYGRRDLPLVAQRSPGGSGAPRATPTRSSSPTPSRAAGSTRTSCVATSSSPPRRPRVSSGRRSTRSGTPARRCCSPRAATSSRCRSGSGTTIRRSRSSGTSTYSTRASAARSTSTRRATLWGTRWGTQTTPKRAETRTCRWWRISRKHGRIVRWGSAGFGWDADS